MSYKQLLWVFLFFSIVLLFSGCKKKKAGLLAEGEGEQTEMIEGEQAPVVCLYDRLSMREKPSYKEGGVVGSLSLSETVTWLGNEREGPNYKGETTTFYKIRDAVDKEGWVLAYFMAPDAKPAVTVHETLLYEKNDELSVLGSKQLEPMTVVAVLEEKEGWINIYAGGEGATYTSRSFWIKQENVSYKREDINTAVFVARALKIEDKEEQKKELERLRKDESVRQSLFFNDLKDDLLLFEKKASQQSGAKQDQQPDTNESQEPIDVQMQIKLE